MNSAQEANSLSWLRVHLKTITTIKYAALVRMPKNNIYEISNQILNFNQPEAACNSLIRFRNAFAWTFLLMPRPVTVTSFKLSHTLRKSPVILLSSTRLKYSPRCRAFRIALMSLARSLHKDRPDEIMLVHAKVYARAIRYKEVGRAKAALIPGTSLLTISDFLLL